MNNLEQQNTYRTFSGEWTPFSLCADEKNTVEVKSCCIQPWLPQNALDTNIDDRFRRRGINSVCRGICWWPSNLITGQVRQASMNIWLSGQMNSLKSAFADAEVAWTTHKHCQRQVEQPTNEQSSRNMFDINNDWIRVWEGGANS